MIRLIAVVLLTISMNCVAQDTSTPRPSLVVTAPAVKGKINPLQTFVGTLYYDTHSNIASEFEGIVQSIQFKEGKAVKKGDVMLSLDTKILQANIAAKGYDIKALQADLSRQERDLKRSKSRAQ